MRCPFCQSEQLKVTDSRDVTEINAVRRRRECSSCLKRFTTFETVDLTLQVKKRDGTYQDFQEEKLMNGIDAACRHTRVSHDQIKEIINHIKADLIEKGAREIASQELGELVMMHLRNTDVVAYIRFACVYKRFKDIRELIEAIQLIAPLPKVNEQQHEEGNYVSKEE